MTRSYVIPKRVFKADQADLAGHARSMQETLNRIPVVENRMIEATYAEPMVLAAPEEPFDVRCVRIADLQSLSTPVTECNGMVHYTWLPQRGGCVIHNIGGMTVAANGGKRYRFYYRITYRTVESG